MDLATFRLQIKDGSYQDIKGIKVSSGSEDLKYPAVGGLDENSSFVSGTEKVKITKLPDGEYKLVEDSTHDGYIIKQKEIEFTISGGVISGTDIDGTAKYEEADGTTLALITITNEPGAALPNTGGPGTKLLYLIGTLLTLFSGGGLLLKRRRNGKPVAVAVGSTGIGSNFLKADASGASAATTGGAITTPPKKGESLKKVTPRGKTTDLANQRFGKLTALEPTAERKNGYTVWLCQCDCGREVLVPSRLLKNGYTKSCGCVPKSYLFQDLTGQRFGRLIVDHMVPERSKNGQVQWFCQCDCGGTVITTTGQLKGNNQRSCGCLSRPPLKDWIGKRVGRLTITAYEGKRKGMHYWKCRCDCGNETSVAQSCLLRESTQSCGCTHDVTKYLHFVEGTCLEIIRNRKTLNKNNTSGVRGVYPARNGGWVAQIVFKGKKKYLGKYKTLDEAAEVRHEAEKLYYDEVLKRYGMEPTS